MNTPGPGEAAGAGRTSGVTWLAVAGWLGAVVVATSVGFAAVSVVSDGVAPVGRSAPLPDDTGEGDDRDRRSEKRTGGDRRDDGRSRVGGSSGRGSGGAAASGGSKGSGASSSRPIRTQVTDGGVVAGRCTASGDVRLISWSPASGWAVLAAEPGPAAQASVTFGGGEGEGDGGQGSVVVTVSCQGTEPLFGVDSGPGEPTDGPSSEPTEPTEPSDGPTGEPSETVTGDEG